MNILTILITMTDMKRNFKEELHNSKYYSKWKIDSLIITKKIPPLKKIVEPNFWHPNNSSTLSLKVFFQQAVENKKI